MNHSTSIGPGGPDDAETLAAFASRAFVDMYGGQDPPGHVREYVARAFDRKTMRQELSDPNYVFLLAKSRESGSKRRAALHGYAKLCKNRTIDALEDPAPIQLERIYVDGTRQSNGLGRRLLDEAVRIARDAGFETIWLSVWEENERAQQFYARNGFEIVGKTYFVVGPEREEDFVLARRLD